MVDHRPARPAPLPAALTLALLAGLLAAAGCSPSSGTDSSEAPQQRDLVIFVYDRSTSVPVHQLELARQLTERRVEALDHGDRVAAVEVLKRSLSEPRRRWSQKVPEREYKGDEYIRRDSLSLERFLADARVYLRSFTDTADRGGYRNTDIFSTLHDVEAEIRAYPDRRPILYVFSDMLQSDDRIEMEGLRNMPDDGWVQQRDEAGRLPDLEGVCVYVAGARTDTWASQQVRSFWRDYFEATGAELGGYTLRPVRVPVHPCRPGEGEDGD